MPIIEYVHGCPQVWEDEEVIKHNTLSKNICAEAWRSLREMRLQTYATAETQATKSRGVVKTLWWTWHFSQYRSKQMKRKLIIRRLRRKRIKALTTSIIYLSG